MLVTGESEPKASGTPWDANSASGLSRTARSRPRRCAYIPLSPPHSASKFGCTLAMTPHSPSRADCSAVTISRCSSRCPQRATACVPSRSTTRCKRVDDGADRGVPDHVEARRDAGFGAGAQMRRDGRRDRGRCCRSGPGRRCTARAARPSATPARRRRTGRPPARGRPSSPCRALACPRSVTASPQYPTISTPCRVPRSSCQSSRPPMSGPAHSWTATIPLAAAASRAAVGRGPAARGSAGHGRPPRTR